MTKEAMLMEGLIEVLCDITSMTSNEVAQMLLDYDIHSLEEFLRDVYNMAGVRQA